MAAGHTSTSYRGTENKDAEGNFLGGGCAGAHGGGGSCNMREDMSDHNPNHQYYQHDGGSQIGQYFHGTFLYCVGFVVSQIWDSGIGCFR